MYDESDLSQEQRLLYENLSKKVVASLKKNNIGADYVSNGKEALDKLKEAIPSKAAIGIGDSVTLHQIGLFRWLEGESDRVIYNPFVRDPEGNPIYGPDETFAIMKKATGADVFLASSNAVTLDGKLVNMDAVGNRVAGMLFGPKKTILVVGANKVVRDVDEAIKRIRNYCVPMNYRRHLLKHHVSGDMLPCVETGICVQCNSPMRICRKLVVIDGQPKLPEGLSTELFMEMRVIVVGEKLGL